MNNGIIFTAYFTTLSDGHRLWEPERDKTRKPDRGLLYPLIDSVSKFSIPLLIASDCFSDEDTQAYAIENLRPQFTVSGNAYRWYVFREYCRKTDFSHVFLVDSTDVECYINPFKTDLGDFLWAGDEKHATVDSPWMKTHQAPYVTMPDYNQIIIENRKHRLLNCGIVGGKREVVLEYLELVTKYQSECNLPDNISVDMAVHNYVIFKHFKDRYKHGVQVNTVFRKNEKPNGVSWWRHK